MKFDVLYENLLSQYDNENIIVTSQLNEYQEFINFLDAGAIINEDLISESLKDKLTFFKDLATETGANIKEIYAIFKDADVFKFMSYFKWSIVKLFEFIREGFKQYHKILGILAKKIHQSQAGQSWDAFVRDMDDFLTNHPVLARLGGIAVASILVYIWFNMTFTGSPEYDFNMTDILTALTGKYTLAAIFSGEEGIKLLLLFVTGKLGLSFPWPGPATIQFTVGVVTTLATMAAVKLKNMKLPKEE